jgi:hypothetical protein
MYSLLKPDLVYQNVSADILEHDEDYDASEWSYSGKQVFRGALDRSYTKWNLDVYWLYDDSLQRVGLAEHDMDDPSIFEALWFRDTPFGTLLQEDGWTTGETLYEKMSPEAYQDASNTNVFLKCHGRLVTPEYVVNGIPEAWECTECGTRSFSQFECKSVKKIEVSSNSFFVDTSLVIYTPPPNSRLTLEHGVCVLHPHHRQMPAEVLPPDSPVPVPLPEFPQQPERLQQ